MEIIRKLKTKFHPQYEEYDQLNAVVELEVGDTVEVYLNGVKRLTIPFQFVKTYVNIEFVSKGIKRDPVDHWICDNCQNWNSMNFTICPKCSIGNIEEDDPNF